MLGAVEFDFPVSRSDNRFVRNSIRVAAVRALLTAHWTRLVRASGDVNHVGHWPHHLVTGGAENARSSVPELPSRAPVSHLMIAAIRASDYGVKPVSTRGANVSKMLRKYGPRQTSRRLEAS